MLRPMTLLQPVQAAAAEPAADLFKTLVMRFKRAQAIRTPLESVMDECFELAMPMRTGFFDQVVTGDRMARVFDDTAVHATVEFASRMQSGITPDNQRWTSLVPGIDYAEEMDEQEQADTERQLASVIKFMFATIHGSNFSSEINEAYQDLAVGTCCVRIDEGTAIQPVTFTTIPLPQLYIINGPNGQVAEIFHARKMPLSDVRATWPDAWGKLPDQLRGKNDDPMVMVVSSCRRDWSDPNVEKWMGATFLPQWKAIIVEEEYTGVGSCPYIVSRWSKASGEVWGRGPLFHALPSIRVANLVVQLVLENAEMAIAGLWTVEDDGTANTGTIKLVPGTIIPTAAGSGGLRRVEGGGNFNVADLVLNDLRGGIRRSLYDEDLGNPELSPKSATEIAARMAKQARAKGAPINRQILELAWPILQRVLYVLKRRGLVKLPAVNGRELAFKPNSPFAQDQNMADVQSITNWGQIIAQLFGPQMANLFIDGAAAAEELRRLFGVPKTLARTETERAELVKGMAALQQQGGTPDGTGQAPIG